MPPKDLHQRNFHHRASPSAKLHHSPLKHLTKHNIAEAHNISPFISFRALPRTHSKLQAQSIVPKAAILWPRASPAPLFILRHPAEVVTCVHRPQYSLRRTTLGRGKKNKGLPPHSRSEDHGAAETDEPQPPRQLLKRSKAHFRKRMSSYILLHRRGETATSSCKVT